MDGIARVATRQLREGALALPHILEFTSEAAPPPPKNAPTPPVEYANETPPAVAAKPPTICALALSTCPTVATGLGSGETWRQGWLPDEGVPPPPPPPASPPLGKPTA